MKTHYLSHRRTFLYSLTSVAGLLCSIVLISLHFQVLTLLQSSILPTIRSIPVLQQQEVFFRQQLLEGQMGALHDRDMFLENLGAYVLPTGTPSERFLQANDVLFKHLEAQNLAANMQITVGEVEKSLQNAEEELRPITLSVDIRSQGIDHFLLLYQLAGTLAVQDLLTKEEISLLLTQTEEAHPRSIVALNNLLHMDILNYLLQEEQTLAQLRTLLPTATFSNALLAIEEHPVLIQARTLFSSAFIHDIQESGVWPMPMLHRKNIQRTAGKTDDWFHLQVQLQLYGRPKSV